MYSENNMFNPPNPESYNRLVWKIVEQIPEGKVSTYGQIASMIPPPAGADADQYRRLGARWVGTAMNNTPSGWGVPWQRVINSQGSISLPPGSASADEQRAMLEREGVQFDGNGRVDFEVVGWDGPPPDFLKEHSLLAPRTLKKRPSASDQMKLF
jgi:methylated-DNA-protein-cysteine methyltransferase related protein